MRAWGYSYDDIKRMKRERDSYRFALNTIVAGSFGTIRLYVRLRLAYRRHGVLPYSRRKTWGEARFAERMGRL